MSSLVNCIFDKKKGYLSFHLGASGKNCIMDGFSRYSLDAKLAIAITANFKNGWTQEENEVEEIGGIARQYDQDFFKSMNEQTGVDLENIVYYKDEVRVEERIWE